MHPVVQSLESRMLLSASSLAADVAKLTADLGTISQDAQHAQTTLSTNAQTVLADLKRLHVGQTPLGQKLRRDIAAVSKILRKDVANIVKAGYKDGQAVALDLFQVNADTAGSPEADKDTLRLARHLKKLKNEETPLVAKLQADLENAQARIGNDLEAIVNSNKTDATLQSDWSSFATAFGDAKITLSADFGTIMTDVNTLIDDAGA